MTTQKLFPPATLSSRAAQFFQRASAERVPLHGSIELTHRCNLACVHCYVNLPAADREAQPREMTAEQIERVIDELADLGIIELTLTGGEPMLRPDFARIYRYAHEKGVLVTVYSNAVLVTDKIVQLFQECPPVTIDVTMYGYTAETYDRVADVGEGQHARWRRGLDKLLAAGIRVSLKTMAMKWTRPELGAMADFARSLGLEFRMDAVLNPRIDGGRKPLAQRLTPQEIAEVETETAERRLAWEDFCNSRKGVKPETDDLYQCGAGLNGFVIDPYGRMHVCELSRKPGWDVVKHGFRRGWYEAFMQVRAQKRVHDDGCGSCATHSSCSNCVGMAELEGRQYEDGNLYFCQTTDARNQIVLGDERPEPNGLIRLRLPHERAAQTGLGDG